MGGESTVNTGALHLTGPDAVSALKMHFYFQLSLLVSPKEAATCQNLSAKYPISGHYPKARAVVLRKHINPAQQEPVSKVADTTF